MKPRAHPQDFCPAERVRLAEKGARSLAALAILIGLSLYAASAEADALSDLSNPFDDALRSGSWPLVLALSFTAGVLTSLTPCVYPMIVITVSVFGASQAKSKLHGAYLSSMYVLGIAALFTPLGLVSATAGGLFGGLLANPWVVFPMAGLFIALAASMFGAFELSLPPALQNRLAQMGGLGPRGAFVLGLVMALIAAPCVGPVLTGLLAWIATTGNGLFGALALFTYALGLGLLTWLVGTFAIAIPKTGRWVETVKSVFGVVMLMAALWLVRGWLGLEGLLPKTTAVLVTAALLGVSGIALGALHLSYFGARRSVVLRKTAGVALASLGLLGVVLWLGAPPELPPGARIAWLDDYTLARQQAEREHRPLLVDFGASWCGACGELDRETFSDPRVVSDARRFVAVRVDLSPGADLARGQALLSRYGQRGLPLVVLHRTGGQEAARITSFVPPERMVELMRGVR